jgi:hypothetical protein
VNPAPEAALTRLAALLRAEDTVISQHVTDPAEEPSLGVLAASGPRSREAPGEYALAVESIREGYLLHYGTPRVLAPPDADLALLAGDYLYALGLERLANMGDLFAVRELSNLISLCAQLHAEGRAGEESEARWHASAVTLAGESEG